MSLFCEARIKGEVEYTLGDRTFYECRPCGAEAVPVMTGYEGPAVCVDCLARQLAGGEDWWGFYDGTTPADAPTTDSAAWYATLLSVYQEEHPGVVAATPGILRAWFQKQLTASEEEEKKTRKEELVTAWHAADAWIRATDACAGNRFSEFLQKVQEKMTIETELRALEAGKE